MSGQSITDRIVAARHSLAGQGLAKTVCKATTEEVMGPKKKHLDYLLQCTNEPNVSIPQMADLLIQRTQEKNWVIVFKSLISIHNIMNYGNERFTQYLASNNCSFNLGSFLDKSGVQGYDMSTFIRRYAKYLNEKAVSYRVMAFDFCKVKRGKDDGLLRTMNTDKLLKALPVLQQQVDALLEFDCTPNELTNGVINACFMLLFKDLIRLFACYNDGIINLLEKYFEMNKKQCREALDIYKKFLVRMERVSEMLKVAENVGIDKGDIPDLAKAPSSLLEALEAHLASLDAQKKGGTTPTSSKPASVATAINSLSSASSQAAANISEDEKRRIIEEEKRQIEALKVEQKEIEDRSKNPFAATTNTTSELGGIDLLGSGLTSPTSGNAAAAASSASDDLFSLPTGGAAPSVASNNPFASSMAPSSGAPPVDLFSGSDPSWGTPAASQPTATSPTTAMSNGSGFDAKFDAVFGGQQPQTQTSSGFDGFGEVMAPASQQPVATMPSKKDTKLIQGDVDTSMALLAGNLNIGRDSNQVKKDHQWNPSSGEKRMTGGANYQQGPMPTVAGGAYPQPMMAGGMQMGGGMGMQPMVGQQPMMGAGFQPMGMQPQMGMGQPMMGYGAMPQQQPQQMGFGVQPRPGAPRPNDPFGAL